MRKLYAERQACLIATVKKEFFGQLEIEERAAGMYCIGWLTDAAQMRVKWNRQHQLVARSLSAFSLNPIIHNALVLGYTAFTEQELTSSPF
jgi:GntR family transcriptional regulator/MocR family aminotransferase